METYKVKCNITDTYKPKYYFFDNLEFDPKVFITHIEFNKYKDLINKKELDTEMKIYIERLFKLKLREEHEKIINLQNDCYRLKSELLHRIIKKNNKSIYYNPFKKARLLANS